jgi:hypothetical protein
MKRQIKLILPIIVIGLTIGSAVSIVATSCKGRSASAGDPKTDYTKKPYTNNVSDSLMLTDISKHLDSKEFYKLLCNNVQTEIDGIIPVITLQNVDLSFNEHQQTMHIIATEIIHNDGQEDETFQVDFTSHAWKDNNLYNVVTQGTVDGVPNGYQMLDMKLQGAQQFYISDGILIQMFMFENTNTGGFIIYSHNF